MFENQLIYVMDLLDTGNNFQYIKKASNGKRNGNRSQKNPELVIKRIQIIRGTDVTLNTFALFWDCSLPES